MPNHIMKKVDIIGQKLVDVLVKANVQSSKGEARRLILNGGVYLNNQKVEAGDQAITEKDLIDGRLLLLATGKKNKILLRVEE
ncbi:MAG: S4 domain-containing protein, partial [Parachlamydiaceae bacterium]